MKIDLEELRLTVNRLLDHVIETRGFSEVELGADVYWDIDSAELYDPTQKPSDIELGSFSDDWDFLNNVREGEDMTAVQLAQVAPLLRRVGEQLGEILAGRGKS